MAFTFNLSLIHPAFGKFLSAGQYAIRYVIPCLTVVWFCFFSVFFAIWYTCIHVKTLNQTLISSFYVDRYCDRTACARGSRGNIDSGLVLITRGLGKWAVKWQSPIEDSCSCTAKLLSARTSALALVSSFSWAEMPSDPKRFITAERGCSLLPAGQAWAAKSL